MTDQTPRTEAGRWFAEYLHRSGFFQVDADIAAIEAQARAEGLDVEVLARALSSWLDEYGFSGSDLMEVEDVQSLADRYRAILAGETDR